MYPRGALGVGLRCRLKITLVALALGAALIIGCANRGLSRDGLTEAYISELVDQGIAVEAARCIVERLFDEMSDDELREFNTEGDRLSSSQQERVAALADACGA